MLVLLPEAYASLDTQEFAQVRRGEAAGCVHKLLFVLFFPQNFHPEILNKIKEKILILTATSGDTGKAALEGFKNIEGIKILVFFPNDGVSKVQEKQMITQEGNNTYVYAINGNFDDAQSEVKKIFTDEEIKA